MLTWLNEETPVFPSLSVALHVPNGLLAAGGNLEVSTLLSAYRQGIFPWYGEDEPILWWSPNPRLVLHPAALHISHSLAKTIRRSPWQITLNNAFDKVIAGCGLRHPSRPDTWITSAMCRAYLNLHRAGYAHSIEVFDEEGNLIGGLYGVAIGMMFFGESMFSLKPDASKVALFYLCEHLKQHHFPCIDCQVQNKHLTQLDAESIPRDLFTSKITELTSLKPDDEALWQPCSLAS